MNTGKGTDDTSDRGKEVQASIEACVSTCSTVRAPGGKECGDVFSFLALPSTPRDLALNNTWLYQSNCIKVALKVQE